MVHIHRYIYNRGYTRFRHSVRPSARETGTAAAGRPGPERVSLATIARKAGVAVSTVSAILGAKAHCFASQETRERVLATAQRLRYVPNRLALGLRGGRTHTVGLVLPALANCAVLAEKIDQLEIACRERGYRLLVAMHREDVATETACIEELLGYRVDGLILQPAVRSRGELVQRLVGSGVAVVTMDSHFDFPTADVTVDREEGGRLQVEYLWRRGCRKLAILLSGASHPLVRQRVSGYATALATAGSSLREQWVVTREASDMWNEDRVAAGVALCRRALWGGRRPDGIVAGSDMLAMGAISQLTARGLQPGRDVEVAGFDDESFTGTLPFRFATIRQPREVGRIAFELLMKQLEAGAAPPVCEQVKLKPVLVVHQPRRVRN